MISLDVCWLFRFGLDFLLLFRAFFDALSVFSLGQVSRPGGRVWSLFGTLRGLLGALVALLGRSRGSLGRSWSVFGRPWALLGASWSILGRFWDDFRSLVRRFSTIFDTFSEVWCEHGCLRVYRKNLGKTIVFQRFFEVGGRT